MKKAEFMAEYNLDEKDWQNLVRYEKTRRSGRMNMYRYLYLMKKYNVNGGEKLADLILSGAFYEKFLAVERNK